MRNEMRLWRGGRRWWAVEFEEFMVARAPVLLRTAAFISGDLALAEDLVQEALIKVHRCWADIGDMEARDAYVRRIVVNEFLSWRRKWARVVPFAEVTIDEPLLDRADADADQRLLRVELARLPVRRRIVLVLRYYGGLSDAEIAHALGCQVSTVRSLATRALAALRINPTLRAEYTVHGAATTEESYR